MAVPQPGEGVDTDDGPDWRPRLGYGKRLRTPGQAVAAVAARFRARLAEVGDEGTHLTVVVRDERDYVFDPSGLGILPACEPVEQAVDEVRLGLRPHKQRVAL